MKIWLIRLFLLLLIGFQIVLVAGSFKKTIPFEIQSLLGSNNPVRQQYEQDSKNFNDETINWILVSKKTPFAVEEIWSLSKQISSILEMNYGVESINGPHNAKYFQYDQHGFFLSPFIQDQKWTAVAKSELSDPLWKNKLIHEDQKSFLFSFKTISNLPRKEEQPVLNNIENALNKIAQTNKDLTISMLGAKTASADFLTEMQFQQRVITPLLLIAIAAFFYFCFGSLQIIAWSFFTLFIVYTSTLILIILTEGGLGPYSSFALMFSFIVATTDLIHFFGRYQQLSGSASERLKETIRIAWLPCLLTSLTTAAGFLALIVNQNLPIRYFGIYCAFSCMLEWFIIFYLLPIFLPAFHFNPKENHFDSLSLSTKLDQILNRYSRQFVLFTFVVIFGGIFLSLNLKVDDNFYTKFKEDYKLSKTLQNFSQSFDFVGSINLLIKPLNPTEKIFNETLKEDFQNIEDKIFKNSEVSKISSFRQIYENLESKLPKKLNNQSSEEIKLSVLHMLNNYGVMSDYYNEQSHEYRTTIFLRTLSTDKLNSVLETIEKIALENKDRYTIRPSGFSVIRSYINGHVISDFFESFFLSFFLIFLCYLFLYKSFKWSFLALIPNAAPLLAVSGLMGLFHVPVDTNLVILICITFGIAGDNTVHLSYVIRQEQQLGLSYSQAIQKAFKLIGVAMIATNGIFLFCLPIFMLGSLRLFTHIAIFLSIAFVFSFISDVFMFPALQKRLGWSFNPTFLKTNKE